LSKRCGNAQIDAEPRALSSDAREGWLTGETTAGSFGQKECVEAIALYNREARGCEGAAQWERKRNEWMETQSATKKKSQHGWSPLQRVEKNEKKGREGEGEW
jgi:hypothetical protein